MKIYLVCFKIQDQYGSLREILIPCDSREVAMTYQEYHYSKESVFINKANLSVSDRIVELEVKTANDLDKEVDNLSIGIAKIKLLIEEHNIDLCIELAENSRIFMIKEKDE